MSRTIEYNSSNDEPAYKNFRLTISNPVLVQAIQEHQINTGMDERELIRESLIHYLEDKERVILE